MKLSSAVVFVLAASGAHQATCFAPIATCNNRFSSTTMLRSSEIETDQTTTTIQDSNPSVETPKMTMTERMMAKAPQEGQ